VGVFELMVIISNLSTVGVITSGKYAIWIVIAIALRLMVSVLIVFS